MKVEVVLAWPRRFESILLELAEGTILATAIERSGLPLEGVTGFAVHGVRATSTQVLHDGDRIEMLRPLQVDPKDARRRRAAQGPR